MSNDLFEDSQESSPEPCKYVNSKYKFFEVLLHQLPQKLQNGLSEILLSDDNCQNSSQNLSLENRSNLHLQYLQRKKIEDRPLAYPEKPGPDNFLFQPSNTANLATQSPDTLHGLSSYRGATEKWCLDWLQGCAAQAQRSLESCWQMLKDFGLSNYVRFSYFAECYRESQNCIERELQGVLRIIVAHQTEYPKSLFALRRPPRLLFWSGHVPDFPVPTTAIIGSRQADSWGMHQAWQEAVLLANCREAGQNAGQSPPDHWIISGLAQGCDYAAHQGALDAGGRTLAVLPSGFDHIYPKSHKRLAQNIVEAGGGLVSEYAPQAVALKWRCIQRDRIQAALAQQVLLIQSSREGGSMHTVRAALQMGKPLYVLDGSESCHQISGSNTQPLSSAVSGQQDPLLMSANHTLLAENLALLWRRS